MIDQHETKNYINNFLQICYFLQQFLHFYNFCISTLLKSIVSYRYVLNVQLILRAYHRYVFTLSAP